MGIKGLWSILAPYCERKPLFELQGKKVAVDLSCWICEAQNITEYTVQPRMYLRNLYFRTCYLLLMDVSPVFVLEGKAPMLKYDTIAARNAIQFKGAKPKTEGVKTGKDRTRFHYTLKQCQEMLECLGLACIQGNGEAEAMCAYLNADQLVDGCISQDSDCFAYGAKIVYRNFSISQQGAHATGGGAVDVYDIEKATKSIDFGQNKVIALALLCGSDYSDGVSGVGKDSVVKLFCRISNEEILVRMKNWRQNTSLYEEFERKASDSNICSSCGHSGRIQAHNKTGCLKCKTTKGCDFTKYKEERLQIKNELNVRNRALVDPNFPDQTLIDEFSVRKDNVKNLNLKWKQPDIIKFVKFASKYLTWEEVYAFEKFLPVVTRWQLLNGDNLKKVPLQPERIKKKRNPKGIASYEIIWKDTEGCLHGLIPDTQLETADKEKLWSTIEPQHLVKQTYPNLVLDFERSKTKKKSTKRNKNGNPVDEIDAMLQNTSISAPKNKRRKNTKKATKQTKTIDDYFGKNTPITSTPGRNGANHINGDFEEFFDDDSNDENLDLSNIIEDIISRSPPKYLSNFNVHNHLIEKPQNVPKNKINSSSFFMTNMDEEDLFEKTLNDMKNDSNSDHDSFDEFDTEYVPLSDRIKSGVL